MIAVDRDLGQSFLKPVAMSLHLHNKISKNLRMVPFL